MMRAVQMNVELAEPPRGIETHLLDGVVIPGGSGLIGTDRPYFAVDGEGPLRYAEVQAFRMTPTTVTNRVFARFVEQTGYRTEAERFGWSFVYFGAVIDRRLIKERAAAVPWWCRIEGACWFRPAGSTQLASDFDALPVVHVSWNDAAAFAIWAGGRLPSEAEWEHAARGGLNDVKYPWGDAEPSPADPKCHVGQSRAPDLAASDIGPIAADRFEPNGYGLFNMVGNVWEWTRDSWQKRAPEPPGSPPSKILKGGSYLCHRNTCFRYRVAARIANTVDSSQAHTGFRVVWPA